MRQVDTFFNTIQYQSMKRSDEMVDRLNRCLQVVPTQLARLLINDFFFKQKDLRACHRALQKKKGGAGGLGGRDLLGSMLHASINN